MADPANIIQKYICVARQHFLQSLRISSSDARKRDVSARYPRPVVAKICMISLGQGGIWIFRGRHSLCQIFLHMNKWASETQLQRQNMIGITVDLQKGCFPQRVRSDHAVDRIEIEGVAVCQPQKSPQPAQTRRRFQTQTVKSRTALRTILLYEAIVGCNAYRIGTGIELSHTATRIILDEPVSTADPAKILSSCKPKHIIEVLNLALVALAAVIDNARVGLCGCLHDFLRIVCRSVVRYDDFNIRNVLSLQRLECALKVGSSISYRQAKTYEGLLVQF